MPPDFLEVDDGTYLSVDKGLSSELMQVILDTFKNAREEDEANPLNNQTTQEEYKTIKVKKRTIHPAELEDTNTILVGIDKDGFLTSDAEKIVELLEVLH